MQLFDLTGNIAVVTGATIGVDGGRTTVPVPPKGGGDLGKIYSEGHTFN